MCGGIHSSGSGWASAGAACDGLVQLPEPACLPLRSRLSHRLIFDLYLHPVTRDGRSIKKDATLSCAISTIQIPTGPRRDAHSDGDKEWSLRKGDTQSDGQYTVLSVFGESPTEKRRWCAPKRPDPVTKRHSRLVKMGYDIGT